MKVDAKKIEEITVLASHALSQKEIAEKLNFSHCRFQKNERIRKAWLKGNINLKEAVKKAYSALVISGENWPAMKHFLATQCDIVEPKETVIITEKKADLTLEQAIAIKKILEKKND